MTAHKIKPLDKEKAETESLKKQLESTKTKKRIFIANFVQNQGMVQMSCDAVGINRTTYARWCKKDAKFVQNIQAAMERKLDKIETKLLNLVETGDTQATIFTAKCLLKQRGYTEKKDINVTGNMNVNILSIDPISDEVDEVDDDDDEIDY